jgi:CRISPR-associated protein Cmx8
VKEGNNVKAMSSGRISPNNRVLSAYQAIAAPKDEGTRFRNPIFRRGLILALLDNDPWYRPFGRVLPSFDVDLFIRRVFPVKDNQPEKGAPQFANDAAKKFRHESRLFKESQERSAAMTGVQRPPASLPVVVNRVVRNYLLNRTSEKSGVKLEKFKTADDDIDWKSVPPEFNDAKQKLAQSLFLEFRSRHDQAFANHFAATFFSVTQRLAESDRLALAQVLTDLASGGDRIDDLKTLTLLALSANS